MTVVCEKQVLMQQTGVITVPVEFRKLIQAIKFIKDDAGHIALEPLSLVDANERWFHHDTWQKGERAAIADFKKGKVICAKSASDLMAGLDK